MNTAIAVLVSYLIALVVAGDGGAPMAVLLVWSVMDGTNAWFFPVIIAGWVGITGLICATFLFRSDSPKQLNYQFLSSIILYLSWLVIAIIGNEESGSLFSSFILSAPLQVMFIIMAYRFWLQHKRGVQIPIL